MRIYLKKESGVGEEGSEREELLISVSTVQLYVHQWLDLVGWLVALECAVRA